MATTHPATAHSVPSNPLLKLEDKTSIEGRFLLVTLHFASTLLATCNFPVSGSECKMCLTWTRSCARCDEVFTEQSAECIERQRGAPHPMDVSSAHTVERISLESLPRCRSFYCRRKDRLEARSTYADVQRRKAFNKQYQEQIKDGTVARMGPFQPDHLKWAEEGSLEDRWGARMLHGHEILLWKPIERVPLKVEIPDNVIECLRRVYNAPLCDMSPLSEVESLAADIMVARPDLVVTRRPPSYAQPPISGNGYQTSEISQTQSEAGATNGGSVSETLPSSEGGTWIDSVNSSIHSFNAQHAIGRAQEVKRQSTPASYERGLAHSARNPAEQNEASTPAHSPRSSSPNVTTPKHNRQLSLVSTRTPDSDGSDKTVTPATFGQQRHKESGSEEVTTPARRARIQVAMPDISRLPPMTGSMSRKSGTKVAAVKNYAEALKGTDDAATSLRKSATAAPIKVAAATSNDTIAATTPSDIAAVTANVSTAAALSKSSAATVRTEPEAAPSTTAKAKANNQAATVKSELVQSGTKPMQSGTKPVQSSTEPTSSRSSHPIQFGCIDWDEIQNAPEAANGPIFDFERKPAISLHKTLGNLQEPSTLSAAELLAQAVAAWPPGKTFSSNESGMPAIVAAFKSLKGESGEASTRAHETSSSTLESFSATRGRSSKGRGTASSRKGKSSARKGKSSSRKAKSSTPRDISSTRDGTASATSEEPPLTGKTSSSESSDSSGGVPLRSEHVHGLDGSFDDPVPVPPGHDRLLVHSELFGYGQDQFMGQHEYSFPAHGGEHPHAGLPTDPGPHHGLNMDEPGAFPFHCDLETLQMGQIHTPSQLLTSQQEEEIAHSLNYEGVVAIKHAIRPAWQRHGLAQESTVNVERLLNDHLPENASRWVRIPDLSQVRPPHEVYKDPPPYPEIDPLNYDFVGDDDEFFPQWMHDKAGNPPPPEYMQPTYPTMPSAIMHTQYSAGAQTAPPMSHPHGRSMGPNPTASAFTPVPRLNHPAVGASFRSPSPTHRFDLSPRAAAFSPRGRRGG